MQREELSRGGGREKSGDAFGERRFCKKFGWVGRNENEAAMIGQEIWDLGKEC